jgi:ubiquinone/menaquinone biosynthesis C-methylase UbiE
MLNCNYLMESDDEGLRLDKKTTGDTIEKQALWAGIRPGMRVVDLGCGVGKTTFFLHQLVQPEGTVIGIDASSKRISHAQEHYKAEGIEFIRRDFAEPLDDLGLFDFIWVRFVLEYYLSNSFQIVKNISRLLKPGGILCLIDLDHNCLNHYGQSDKLERSFRAIMKILEEKADFDPYVGRKLYSFLYDLGYKDIEINVDSHHLIFGELTSTDAFNWAMKAEVAARNAGYAFDEYAGGFDEFFQEFKSFFNDPRRFTYTPIISCRGCKP